MIDPRYFRGISGSIPRISGAEILLKRGSSYELTRYRYDVVLRVDREPVSAGSENSSLVPDMKHGQVRAVHWPRARWRLRFCSNLAWNLETGCRRSFRIRRCLPRSSRSTSGHLPNLRQRLGAGRRGTKLPAVEA